MSRSIQNYVCRKCDESWPVGMIQDKRGDGSWYVEELDTIQCPECGEPGVESGSVIASDPNAWQRSPRTQS